jgi:CDP-paratose 2-epimerase
MSLVLVTGSGGLIGSETVRFFSAQGFQVVGIDNDSRKYFFGSDSSTQPISDELARTCPGFVTHNVDIRDGNACDGIFRRHGRAIALIVHAAAQPSHDWAAREPLTDFGINATGTLNLLEAARHHCPDAVFIYTSTNKVYGDTPNRLPLVEQETRWELEAGHPFSARGIDESMSIDQSLHSLFGVSKLAGDILVQEYARYFGLRTGIFRCGCLSGPQHVGTELHGFLSYMMKCACSGREYRIFGYQGKQVRDTIHSHDVLEAFSQFFKTPRPGEVYNLGGGRFSHCSLREAIHLCETISGRPMKTVYVDQPRTGDHCWWVSDASKFKSHFPAWSPTRSIPDILRDIHLTLRD